MSRTNRRVNTKNKVAEKARVAAYYAKFRNGKNRKNNA